MKKVVILGSCGISHIAAQTLAQHNMGVVIVSSNPAFKPEPLVFKYSYVRGHEPAFYEKEPSKFMSKPKNNFKKR